jgi:hypothetical protein
LLLSGLSFSGGVCLNVAVDELNAEWRRYVALKLAGGFRQETLEQFEFVIIQFRKIHQSPSNGRSHCYVDLSIEFGKLEISGGKFFRHPRQNASGARLVDDSAAVKDVAKHSANDISIFSG